MIATNLLYKRHEKFWRHLNEKLLFVLVSFIFVISMGMPVWAAGGGGNDKEGEITDGAKQSEAKKNEGQGKKNQDPQEPKDPCPGASAETMKCQ